MKVREVLNLTPHAVTLIQKDGSTVVYQPEPEPARVSVTLKPIGGSASAPMFKEVYGDVVGLPSVKYGTILIVSGLVCTARPDRLDLVHPVDFVRDENGRIIGCRGFAPNGAGLIDYN